MTEVVHTIAELETRLRPARLSAQPIGFVPTMGALHEGHVSLITRARRETSVVVVSIFVNPTQFNQAEDYDLYPRTLEADTLMCDQAGVDLIFAPDAREVYPRPLETYVETGSVSEQLCGRFRPGHFRGVATVVMKLFQIVRPDRAYFGEKDAQQLAVIRRMVVDLNIAVEIVGIPTLRESDGLALSSRNQRLGKHERSVAPTIRRALKVAAADLRNGDISLRSAKRMLASEPDIQLEYLEVVDPDNMQPVSSFEKAALIAIAAWLGGVRLIDNIVVSPKTPVVVTDEKKRT